MVDMKPAEMADRLLELAAGGCTETFGEAGYTCREYDRAALYNGELPDCDRCQALNALDRLRSPWRENDRIWTAAARDIVEVIERANKAAKVPT